MIQTIRSGHATSVGRVREHNEDSYGVTPDAGLWIVADGMGGHEGGEIASEITVRTVLDRVQDGHSLEQSIIDAHEAVLEAGQNGIGKAGMGSTLVALRIQDGQYEIAWVGDSRVYLWNGRSLVQVTRDHSYVQMLLENQLIEPEQVRSHPMRHIVSQAIGNASNGQIEVDTVRGSARGDYRFLLCSDGLTDEVDDARIGETIASADDVQTVADRLVGMALESGGSDNITVLVVETAG